MGTPLLRFHGPLIDRGSAVALGDDTADPLQVGADDYVWLRGTPQAFNHSCDPNCGVRPDLVLVTLRGVSPGEELTWDYSTSIGDEWTMPCRCGSPHCRGTIGSWWELPADVQRERAAAGVVQDFLLDGDADVSESLRRIVRAVIATMEVDR